MLSANLAGEPELKAFADDTSTVQGCFFGTLRYWLYSMHMNPKLCDVVQRDTDVLWWSRDPIVLCRGVFLARVRYWLYSMHMNAKLCDVVQRDTDVLWQSRDPTLETSEDADGYASAWQTMEALVHTTRRSS